MWVLLADQGTREERGNKKERAGLNLGLGLVLSSFGPELDFSLAVKNHLHPVFSLPVEERAGGMPGWGEALCPPSSGHPCFLPLRSPEVRALDGADR